MTDQLVLPHWRVRLRKQFPATAKVIRRLCQARRVLWRGLPVVEVEYRTVPEFAPHRYPGPSSRTLVTKIRYEGIVHGVVNGENVWSNNSEFTIEQPLAGYTVVTGRG